MSKVCPVCGASYADTTSFCPTDGSTLRNAEQDGELIGTVIADRYLVTELLGAGGMGTVYLARHVRLPQQAAIKVLRRNMVRDGDAVARFNREAANASRIDHERIARVFDFGETSDGTVYLAMEYVPGRTLKQIIAADGVLSLERTSRITRQVGEALDAAHRLGIVHRDLKPDNIMVIEDAELGDRCKVVDFGIAKAMGGGEGEPGLTKTGFVVGTPEFMSPEQLFGAAVDHRSDVYALALVIYQCLTGALPFDSSTPERTMTARLTESPQPLAVVRPDIVWDPGIQAVFDRGLAKDPGDRYLSAGAFARAFEAAVAPKPTGAATTDSPPEAAAVAAQAAAPDSPMPPLSATTTPAVDGLAPAHHAAAAKSTPLAAAASSAETRPRTTSAEGGSRSMLGIAAGVAAVLGVAVLAFIFTRAENEAPGDSASLSNPAIETSAPPRNDVTAPPEPMPVDSMSSGEIDSSVQTSPVPSSTPRPAANTSAATPSTQTRDAAAQSESPVSTEAVDRARRTLDSLRVALNPATATAAEARRAVAVLRGLLPQLPTAEDSAWAYLRQAEGHVLMDDVRSACLALGAARPLARTPGQQQIVSLLSGGC